MTIESAVMAEGLPIEVAAPRVLADEGHYEVVSGRIVETAPMGAYECDVATFLAQILGRTVHDHGLGKIVVEALFWLDRTARLKRRPDLAFVADSKWPMGKRAPRTEAWDVIPDLAVEIVSDSNSASEINLKVVEYLRAGVRQVWVIYPATRQVYIYTSPTQVQVLTEPGDLDGGDVVPGFRLSLGELFGDAPAEEPARTRESGTGD